MNEYKVLSMINCAHVSKDEKAPRQKFLEIDDGMIWFRWCGEEECNTDYKNIISMWEVLNAKKP